MIQCSVILAKEEEKETVTSRSGIVETVAVA